MGTPSALPSLDIPAIFKLFGDCLAIATVLVLAAVPLVLISYELWKEKVR
jgi:hypothetical protein